MTDNGRGWARFCVRSLAVATIGPLDFRLAAGECLALSGPSGAGKTRLLRAMAGVAVEPLRGGRGRQAFYSTVDEASAEQVIAGDERTRLS